MGVMMQGALDDKRREHLCKLLSKLFEDLLSEDETVLLEAMLSESEEARLLYMQYVDLQVELGCLVVEEHMQNKLVRFPSSISKRKANKIPARRFAEAAVILVGIGWACSGSLIGMASALRKTRWRGSLTRWVM